MTLDDAVAISLIPYLSRIGLTERLRCDDPELLERAAPFIVRAGDVRERATRSGIGVLPWNDPRFPAMLLALTDCAPALWFRGTPSCLEAPAVAIVGSRAASTASLDIAGVIASDLAANGVTVVSGLARGVDSAAHRGALERGRTVAVLGSSVDRVYPPEHVGLGHEIAAAGMVVSEYPPGTPPRPVHFPQRNRLISGLCRAVVVIEASEKSGSLITAACALEQGREVMAVPGDVRSGRNSGGHALIRDGATIVESADDILLELGLLDRRTGLEPRSASGPKISGDAVLDRMEWGRAMDLDALAAATGLETARLLPRLMELELSGLVRRVGGGRFMRRS